MDPSFSSSSSSTKDVSQLSPAHDNETNKQPCLMSSVGERVSERSHAFPFGYVCGSSCNPEIYVQLKQPYLMSSVGERVSEVSHALLSGSSCYPKIYESYLLQLRLQNCCQGFFRELEKYTEVSIEESESSIYRVHKRLRNVNRQAYEPEIVSIGPYHRGKDDLKMMEGHKRRYLHLILERKKDISRQIIFKTVAALEPKVRKCYAEAAEPISLNTEEFVEMLVLDGCFIIELVRKYYESHVLRQMNDDPIFCMDWIIVSLQRDLMLFENQIPFSVLQALYDLIEIPNQLQEGLTSHIISFFKTLFPGEPNLPIEKVSSLQKIKHLLHLIHCIWLPPFHCKNVESSPQKIKHLLHLIHCIWLPPFLRLNIDQKIEETSDLDVNEKEKQKRRRFISSVVGLREANVKFKKNEDGSLFHIQFKNGTMLIPPLRIEDRTEAFFRNLIAYEQYDSKCIPAVTDYVKFLDCLVNSSKDVEILSRLEIVENWLGDDEVVAKMVNKLNDFVTGSGSNFFYAKTFTRVNDHCRKRRNKWMAKLRRNYLNSPWAIISIVVAVVLLLLTVTQTVFSVLQVV